MKCKSNNIFQKREQLSCGKKNNSYICFFERKIFFPLFRYVSERNSALTQFGTAKKRYIHIDYKKKEICT